MKTHTPMKMAGKVWMSVGLALAAFLVLALMLTTSTDAGDPEQGGEALEVLTVREPSEYSEALPRPEIERAVIQLASEVDGVAELGLEGEVLLIEGKGFYGTAVGPFVRIGGVEAEIVLLLSGSRIVTTIPSTARGATEFVVINPDGRRVEGAIESATSQSGEGRRR